MAWEMRGKRRYYYRARRRRGRIEREYLGAGPKAIAAAHADEIVRASKARQMAEIRSIEQAVESLIDRMTELELGTTMLTHGALLAAGFHQHRGNWRRRRD